MRAAKKFFIGIGVSFLILIALVFAQILSDWSASPNYNQPVSTPHTSSAQDAIAQDAIASDEGSNICLYPHKTPPGSFKKESLDLISETSRGNEARFDRDYKGRIFADCLYFDGLERDFFDDSSWSLKLDDDPQGFMYSASCDVDTHVASQMADVEKGDVVFIQGSLKTTVMGVVIVDDCHISIYE